MEIDIWAKVADLREEYVHRGLTTTVLKTLKQTFERNIKDFPTVCSDLQKQNREALGDQATNEKFANSTNVVDACLIQWFGNFTPVTTHILLYAIVAECAVLIELLPRKSKK